MSNLDQILIIIKAHVYEILSDEEQAAIHTQPVDDLRAWVGTDLLVRVDAVELCDAINDALALGTL